MWNRCTTYFFFLQHKIRKENLTVGSEYLTIPVCKCFRAIIGWISSHDLNKCHDRFGLRMSNSLIASSFFHVPVFQKKRFYDWILTILFNYIKTVIEPLPLVYSLFDVTKQLNMMEHNVHEVNREPTRILQRRLAYMID